MIIKATKVEMAWCCFGCRRKLKETENENETKTEQLPETSKKILNKYEITHFNNAALAGNEKLYIAQYDFLPGSAYDIEMHKGDSIEIKQDEFDSLSWVIVLNLRTLQTGFVPFTYLAKETSLEGHEWYFGEISLSAAETLLLWKGNPIGAFLVRKRSSVTAPFALCIRHIHDGLINIKHYMINYQDENYFISKGICATELPVLIKTYLYDSSNSLLLCTNITTPCQKTEPTKYDLSEQFRTNWEISRREITIENLPLGGGAYAQVFKGKWKNQTIAVKIAIDHNLPLADFQKESNAMKLLKHKNVISLYGVCTKERPYYIVTEYMQYGDLEHYLRKRNTSEINKIYITIQIACGMEYLEQSKVVHRDLAARNILLGEKLTAKIADFGLSRYLALNSNYVMQSDDKIPNKWLAPENFNRIFTTKSDVWAFGITLMEIFTDCDRLYKEFSNNEEIRVNVCAGYRMPPPPKINIKIYNKMLECWHSEPNQRPTFSELYTFFNSMNEM